LGRVGFVDHDNKVASAENTRPNESP
jgi:hypothetical protein